MAMVSTVRKCGHPQTDWVPNFKDVPGPVGQDMIIQRQAKPCADCFFARLDTVFGINFRAS